MTIYRGSGGTGEATTDTDITEVRELMLETKGYRDQAATSSSSSSSSSSAAATSASNAATSASNASSSASAAASSASAASDDADLAESARIAAQTAQTAAELAETHAETAETNAETAQAAAEAARDAAQTAETNAETAETNATASAILANDWATKTSGPVAGGEYSAKYNAQLSASSASAASTSASNAASSASSASSAQAAAEAARDAALSAYDNFDDRYLGPKASDPALDNDGNALLSGALYFNTATNVMKVYTGSSWVAAYVSAAGVLLAVNNLSDLTNVSTARTNLGLGTAALVADSTLVHTSGAETIAGVKTFSSTISGSVSGNAGTVTNGVYTSGSYADPTWITSLAGSKVSGNISGNAANVTGTVAIANGGTGAITAAAALTALGAYPATNPSGYTTNTGTVTSVGGTGTVSGLTLTGTVTTSGSLTLGGTLAVTPSNFASQTANYVLAAPNGTAGVPTFRAIVAADIPTLNQNTTGSSGSCTGNAATATTATNATNTAITNDTTTATAQYITFVAASSGNTGQKTHSTGLTFVPSTGAFTASGNVTAYSDERIKCDWKGLDPDFIERLALVKNGTYTRIDNDERQAGSSAQDWQKLLPEVVSQNDDENKTLSLAYGNAALVSVIELAKRVVAQEERIKRLESLVEKLIGD